MVKGKNWCMADPSGRWMLSSLRSSALLSSGAAISTPMTSCELSRKPIPRAPESKLVQAKGSGTSSGSYGTAADCEC